CRSPVSTRGLIFLSSSDQGRKILKLLLAVAEEPCGLVCISSVLPRRIIEQACAYCIEAEIGTAHAEQTRAGIELQSIFRFSNLQILRSHDSHFSDKSHGRGTCQEREIGDIGVSLRYSSVMIKSVDAIYEDGKLVLQQPLPLPEHAHVRVTFDTDMALDG